jgi:hypothetical protein
MPITKEKIVFVSGSPIYYTDKITIATGQGTLTVSKIVLTSDVTLIDTSSSVIDWPRHIGKDLVLIKDKV